MRDAFVEHSSALGFNERVLTFGSWNKLTDPAAANTSEALGLIDDAVRDTTRSPWLTLAWEETAWFEGFGKVFAPITDLHARAVEVTAAHAAAAMRLGNWRELGDCPERLHHCLMHGLFRPRGDALANALGPSLRSFDKAASGRGVVAVHVRTGYSDLAGQYSSAKFLERAGLPKAQLLALLKECGGLADDAQLAVPARRLADQPVAADGDSMSDLRAPVASTAKNEEQILARCWHSHFACWDAWPESLIAGAPHRLHKRPGRRRRTCGETLADAQPLCDTEALMHDFEADLMVGNAHGHGHSSYVHEHDPDEVQHEPPSPVSRDSGTTSCLEREWAGGYNASCLAIRKYTNVGSLGGALACAATMAQRAYARAPLSAPTSRASNISSRIEKSGDLAVEPGASGAGWVLFVASDSPGLKELASELLPSTRGRTISIATACDAGQCHMADHGRGSSQSFADARAATMAEWYLLGLARFQIGVFFSTFSSVGASRSVWLHQERYYELPGAHPVLIFPDRLMKALGDELCRQNASRGRDEPSGDWHGPRTVCQCDSNPKTMHACLEAETMIVLRGNAPRELRGAPRPSR